MPTGKQKYVCYIQEVKTQQKVSFDITNCSKEHMRVYVFVFIYIPATETPPMTMCILRECKCDLAQIMIHAVPKLRYSSASTPRT